MEQFVQVLLGFSEKMGHFGVFFLMVIESSFIPFPSEIVIPPAAFLAYQGKMNIYLIVLYGTAGSIVGALINYFLAKWLGRSLVYAIAKRHFMRYLLITHHKIESAENYFLKYGDISTFIGRLVPVIRQLISLPAGFAKMPLKSFVLYTFLGSFMWVCVLAASGYVLAINEVFFRQYFWQIAWSCIAVVILVVGLVYWIRKWKRS